MSSDWGYAEIGSFAKLRSGFSFKSADWRSEGVAVIKIANIKAGRIVPEGCGFVDEGVAAIASDWYTKAGDVLIAMTGYVGEVARVQGGERYLINQRVGRFEFNGGSPVDAAFLFYVLQAPEFRQRVEGIARGSAQPNLSSADVHKLQVPVPPLVSQRGIAATLSSLDDRITLLRETNATLEAIAQTIFKSWFVDFDPVRAKQEGRAPEGMDEATAALFPGSFEESALGLVPSGWRVGTLADLLRLHKGTVNPLTQPDVVFEHYSLPAFDDGQMPIAEAGAEIKSNKTPVPANAVLISKLNPHIPRVWMPTDAGQHAVCSTEFLVFVPAGGASKYFNYCSFSAPQFLQSLCQLVTGTSNSHQRVKPDGILSLPTIVATGDVLASFSALAGPMFDRIGQNRKQAQTLATLRDTLLPRLISGQLRLPDAEEAVAEAAA